MGMDFPDISQLLFNLPRTLQKKISPLIFKMHIFSSVIMSLPKLVNYETFSLDIVPLEYDIQIIRSLDISKYTPSIIR